MNKCLAVTFLLNLKSLNFRWQLKNFFIQKFSLKINLKKKMHLWLNKHKTCCVVIPVTISWFYQMSRHCADKISSSKMKSINQSRGKFGLCRKPAWRQNRNWHLQNSHTSKDDRQLVREWRWQGMLRRR